MATPDTPFTLPVTDHPTFVPHDESTGVLDKDLDASGNILNGPAIRGLEPASAARQSAR